MVPDYMTEPPRANAQRARTACTFLWVMLVLSVLSIPSSYITSQSDFGLVESRSSAYQAIFVGLHLFIHFICNILTIIFFIRWFRRAYYNLQKFGPPYPSNTHSWAAGVWFVPFINLFQPVRLMREIWELTPLALRQQGQAKELSGGWMISFWWTTWIVGNITSNISTRASLYGDGLRVFPLDVVAGISHIMAAYLLIQIIRTISIEEEALAERVRVHTLQRQSELMHAHQTQEQTAQTNSQNWQAPASQTPSPFAPSADAPPASDDVTPPQQ
ncbi:MAG: DUF4328 domain-containing protein [Bacteroidia bacterium]